MRSITPSIFYRDSVGGKDDAGEDVVGLHRDSAGSHCSGG